MSVPFRLAVVTMTYNEAQFLPLWCRHYAVQVGETQCYVIDHGSTDGSTDTLGDVNLLRIPRSPQDDTRRTRFLSEFCSSLLEWYDAVIYVDTDEFLVADPALFPSLPAYAASVPPGAVRTAIGFDVIHTPDETADLDWNSRVSDQRGWLRFSSAMCKPVLIRRRVNWAPGFHCIDASPEFDHLYLFHLRYADRNSGLERLARTREQAWADPQAGQHQRMADQDWSNMLQAMGGLPRRDDVQFGPDDAVLARWQDAVTQSAIERQNELYRIDLHISGDELWRLPFRFVGTF